MKKSEAVNKMLEGLNYIEKDLEDYAYNTAAKRLLDFIEKELGMLPPTYIKVDPGHFPGDAFEYAINEWEPEDEKE